MQLGHLEPLTRVALGGLVWLALAPVAAAQTSPSAATPAVAPSTAAPASGNPADPSTAETAEAPPVEPPDPAAQTDAEIAASDAALAELEPGGERTPLRRSIEDARLLATELTARVWALSGHGMFSAGEARARESQINSLSMLIGSFDSQAQTLEKREKEATDAKDAKAKVAAAAERTALEGQVQAATSTLASIAAELDLVAAATGWSLVDKLLTARCSTAICFDNGSRRHWLGIEPLVELPIGIGFAIEGSSLADYVNNHDIRVDLAAGVRVWLFRDVISLSVYLSKPLLDTSIQARGSNFVYPGASLRRPYPGFALGLLFDSIWIGFDRNELRNGDGKDGSALNPDFVPNQVISSAWTITLALQPVTAFRTAIGTAVQSNEAGKK